MPREAPDLTRLRDLAVSVATEAGDLAARMRREGVQVAATKSSAVDVVTRADEASQELIRRRLLEARPEDSFLGEEGDDVTGSSGVRWVVDPIDGTVNYLYGGEQYAVSVAAQVEGRTEVGVVRDVARGLSYVAVRGGGATREGTSLRVRESGPVSERLISTGFGYQAAMREAQGRAVARLLPRVRDIRRRGSCALDLCQVAEGSVDGYVEEGPHLWDHAAGALVAQEAGARFEVLRGSTGADLVVCAPAQGFPELLELLDECGFRGEADDPRAR